MKAKKFIACLFALACIGFVVSVFWGEQIGNWLRINQDYVEVVDFKIGNDGNVYTLATKNQKYVLRAMEKDGTTIYERVLPHIGNSLKYDISDFFVSSKGDIYMPVYQYNEQLINFEKLQLYCFTDKMNNTIFLQETLLDSNSDRATLANQNKYYSFSEYNKEVYFPLLSQGSMSVLHHDSNNKQLLIEENKVSILEPVNTAIIMNDLVLVAGYQQGRVETYDVYKNTQKHVVEGVIYNKFMQNARDQIVFLQGNSREMMTMDYQTGEAKVLLNTPARYFDTPLNYIQNVWMSNKEQYSMYSYITKTAIVFSNDILYEFDPLYNNIAFFDIFVAGLAFAAMVLLAMVLTDVYFNYIRGKLSLAIKQMVAYSLCSIIVLDIMFNGIFMQSYLLMQKDNISDRLVSVATMLAASIDITQPDYDVNIALMNRLLHKDGNDVEQIDFALAQIIDTNQAVVRSSSRYYEPGTNARYIKYGADLIEYEDELLNFIKSDDDDSAMMYSNINSSSGVYRYVPGHKDWIITVNISTNRVQDEINNITKNVNKQMICMIIMLIALLTLAQAIISKNLRMVIKGVNMISAGNYDIKIVLNTGDELESLAHSTNAMTATIKSNIVAMDRIISSYFRFVPMSFVKLLGETSALELGKHSHVERIMTVLMVKFYFLNKEDVSDTASMFDNINQVIERTSVLVHNMGGTVYDFNSNGFNAVFDEGSEDALSTSIAIKQTILILNQQRKENGKGGIAMYIALDNGPVMMGIIGDENRMSTSAISETLIVTADLLNICQELEAGILCTQNAMPNAHSFFARYVGDIQHASKLLGVYEVCDGDSYALKKSKNSYKDKFSQAITAFYDRRFDDAKQGLIEIIKNESKDGAARYYLYNAYLYEDNPPEVIALLHDKESKNGRN